MGFNGGEGGSVRKIIHICEYACKYTYAKQDVASLPSRRITMSEVSFGNSDASKELEHVKTVPFRIIPTLLKLAVDIKGFFDTSDSENGPVVSSFVGRLI